jgi:hypothetical protein
MEEIIEQLKTKARATWSGGEGDRRAERLEAFLRKLLPEYAAKLGLTQEAVLRALEGKRDYCCVNYYQEANFPSLENVKVFDSEAELRAAIPSMTFRCPACGKLSTNPYTCNSGAKRTDGSLCDWKSYGLFRTLGKGFRFTIRQGFLDNPRVDDIFMPVEFEQAA